MLRNLGAFVAAVVVTYLCGTIFISQGNLASIAGFVPEITFAIRMDAALHDMSHMFDIYLPIVAIGLLLAFGVAGVIIRFVPNLRLLGYVLGGFVGLVALHVIMKMVLGMTGVAATRTIVGLMMQGVAGAVGGYVFYLVTTRNSTDEVST